MMFTQNAMGEGVVEIEYQPDGQLAERVHKDSEMMAALWKRQRWKRGYSPPGVKVRPAKENCIKVEGLS